jgi:Domain of unknown function (DUF4412)
MKNRSQALTIVVLCLNLIPAYAQMGGPGGGPGMQGPELGGGMAKLFGKNSAFSATLDMQIQDPANGRTMTMPGKMSADQGKSRFEMDMAQMKGVDMPADAMGQMKSMGMDKITMISRPDKKLTYMIYPGLQAYFETPIRNPEAAMPESDFKMETTELGKETVDGHPCVKNKAVVTDEKGNQHESTVWNATDLKDFPIKIETTENGRTMTMLFKDVKLAKPEAGQFEPPADFKHYDSMMALMQQEMMKRMGGGMGMPPQK